MRSRRVLFSLSLALALWGPTGACTESASPLPALLPPDSITAEPLTMQSVRLRWQRPLGNDAASFVVSRRENFTGAFVVVASAIPATGGVSEYIDSQLEPDRQYGYRIVTLGRLGGRSSPSVVAGVRTPARPGILVKLQQSDVNTDPDGVSLVVRGETDTLSTPLPLGGSHRFGPLAPGTYSVILRGLASNCALNGDSTRVATVTDQGANTTTEVVFQITCRDARKGRLVAVVNAAGDRPDTSITIRLTGKTTARDHPDTLVSLTQSSNSRSGRHQYPFDLLAGDYDVEVGGVDPICRYTADSTRHIILKPLATDIARIDLTCDADVPPVQGTGPLLWTNDWSVSSAAQGERVTLTISLDLRAQATRGVTSAEAALRFNRDVLRFDSAAVRALRTINVNGSQQGVVSWNALTNTGAPKGVVQLIGLHFTVVGASGSTITQTEIGDVLAEDAETLLRPEIRWQESKFRATAGAANQPPHAEANGPYAGTAGVPITFSSAGTTDSDGSIASYAWSFGDNASGSGPSPTHAYTTPGTYTATLTVTDNRGATATDAASVTVSAVGGVNQPPIAEANGPYSGAAGTPIAFTAAGSRDPDGTIVAYNWSFGDGGTGSGATVARTYATPGAYTATLTVTDNKGATASDQAAVTVVGAVTQPFAWVNSFGARNPVDSIVVLTVTLDFSTDIAETPGAEQLGTWALDSLRWDPSVLRFHSFNFGAGGFGSVSPDVNAGRLRASGSQGAANNTGRMTIASVRFKVIGTSGRSVTTTTWLGSLTGTAFTGGYAYRPRTRVVESTFSVP